MTDALSSGLIHHPGIDLGASRRQPRTTCGPKTEIWKPSRPGPLPAAAVADHKGTTIEFRGIVGHLRPPRFQALARGVESPRGIWLIGARSEQILVIAASMCAVRWAWASA